MGLAHKLTAKCGNTTYCSSHYSHKYHSDINIFGDIKQVPLSVQAHPTLKMSTSIATHAYPLDDIETGTLNDRRLFTGSLKADISLSQIDSTHAPLESNDLLQNQADLIYYPEGALLAWTVVFGAFCGLCGGVGTMNTMGAFQRHISQYPTPLLIRRIHRLDLRDLRLPLLFLRPNRRSSIRQI
jgi:hypothetical protein